MNFLWPGFLFLLGLIPIITGIYIWRQRHRRRYAVRFSSLSLVREALPKYSRVRRHLPFVLFLLTMASLVTAASRPVTTVDVPSARTTIILAIDVSLSMCSTDIAPNRLRVAKDAALSFIEQQEENIPIGIVAFAGFAAVVQPPTTDQEAIRQAIENLSPARRTAIGSAILKSIDAIAENDQTIAPSKTRSTGEAAPTPVPEGHFAPAIIVLLTDGASNTGTLPVDAAQQAVDRGLRVFTIGFGTANGGGSSLNCRSDTVEGNTPQMEEGQSSGQTFGGWGFRRGIDEETLQAVASMTSGEYYSAESANELVKVFEKLPVSYVFKQEEREVSVAFTALAALLALLAVSLSLMWHSLP